MEIKEIVEKVKNISENCSQDLDYEIVDVEYKKGSKHDLLSILIYNKKGISTDDCKIMSNRIEKELDKDDFIKNPYYLEVSSPGLDRPIKTKDDYRRNLNNEVEVKFYAAIDGKKEIEGILKDYNDDEVIIKLGKEEINIPIKSISIMKQTIKF